MHYDPTVYRFIGNIHPKEMHADLQSALMSFLLPSWLRHRVGDGDDPSIWRHDDARPVTPKTIELRLKYPYFTSR